MKDRREPANLQGSPQDLLDQFDDEISSRIVTRHGRLLAVVSRVTSWAEAEAVSKRLSDNDFSAPATFLYSMMTINEFLSRHTDVIKELFEHGNHVCVVFHDGNPYLSIQALRVGVEGAILSHVELSDEVGS